MIWRTQRARRQDGPSRIRSRIFDDEQPSNWPVHEVGRNADFFDPKSARLLKAGSSIVSDSVHLHSNGRDTKAHLEIGFKFMPKGYKPTYKRAVFGAGQRRRHRHQGDGSRTSSCTPTRCCSENTKIISFEPHLHAPGARMCLEAIWGYNIQTLNCVGYDHNWVRGYDYTDDSAPLLPKGTILHIIGYMDNSPSNKNVPDPRNWQGSGNRSVANMFIDLGQRVSLTDEQFQEEMAKRREQLHLTQERQRHRLPAVHRSTPPATPTATRPEPAAVTASRRTELEHAASLDALVRSWLLSSRAVARRPQRAQSLTYTKGQNVAPAYEGWEQDADGVEVLPVRLHEPQLGGRDRRAGRSRQRLQRRRRRSGAADALPAAPQPLRVPRAGAERTSPRRTS